MENTVLLQELSIGLTVIIDVFKASRRKASEKYGLWVYLNHEVHMKMHDHSKPYETLENDLKAIAQQAFENNGGTREEFRRIFGANYLDIPPKPFPELYQFDNLGEYGKDWCFVND